MKGNHAPPPGACGTGRAMGGGEGRIAEVGRREEGGAEATNDGVFVILVLDGPCCIGLGLVAGLVFGSQVMGRGGCCGGEAGVAGLALVLGVGFVIIGGEILGGVGAF